MNADFTIIAASISVIQMGRGDKKSKKGKRTTGSFGVTRSKNAIKARLKRRASKKSTDATAADAPAKPKRATAAKKKAE